MPCERLHFLRQFHRLLESGQTPLRALAMLKGHAFGARMRARKDGVQASIESGLTLSQAFARQRGLLGEVEQGVLEAYERVGRLQEGLGRLVEDAERRRSLLLRSKPMLLYALFVLHVAVLVPLLPLAFQGSPRMFLGAAVRGLLSLYAGCAGAWALWKLAERSGWIRKAAWRLFSRLPVVGAILRQSSAGRFCRTLALLWEAGFPPAEGVRLAASASGNPVWKEQAVEASGRLGKGGGLGGALESFRDMPLEVHQRVAVAEESGTVGDALTRAGDEATENARSAVEIAIACLQRGGYLLVTLLLAAQVLAALGALSLAR